MMKAGESREIPIDKAGIIIFIALLLAVINTALSFTFNYFQYKWTPRFDREVMELEKQVAGDAGTARQFKEIGTLYYRMKDYRKAEDAFNKALQKEKNLSALYDLSMVYMDTQRYDEAIKTLKIIIAQSPRHYSSYLKLGVAYFNKNDYQNADYALCKALDLNPVSVEARDYLMSVRGLKK